MDQQKDPGDSIDYSIISRGDITSPSQLQEFTFQEQDSTFSSTLGLRSPGGMMRGRTVKEFDEQMSNLKKENFNLKLRIYFLEEKLGTHFTLDKDNIVKRNIDLQIEVASLQKEVQEKHDLLCQAVKAIELEEDEHKKYSQSKEDEVAQMQQELEDLRIQIHDISNLESGIHSVLSLSPTNPSTSRDEHEHFHYPEEHLLLAHHGRKRHGRDHLSHVRSINDQEHVQVIYEHSQALEEKIAELQRENQSKDETVNQINKELDAANERLVEYAQQIKEYEEKLCHSHQVKQSLVLQLQENKKHMDELKQKYVTTKYELENDLEKVRKEGDKTKMMKDMRINMLENENEKHKMRIRDLQTKLDAALGEAKKNQNLAVSSTVTNPAAPARAPEKGSLHLSLETRTPEPKFAPSRVPPTPDGRSLSAFEQLILLHGNSDKLVHEFQQVKEEVGAYKKKIVKLKSEQLKACEIIKNLLEMRDKSAKEFDKVKKEKEALEKEKENLKGENGKLVTELEMVVSKPDNEVVPLTRRAAELNIAAGEVAAGTPPCERASSASFDDTQTTRDNMDDSDCYKALTVELESKIEVLVATLREKDNQLHGIKDQYDELLTMLEEKENRIVDLEFELLSNQESGRTNGSLLEKGDYSMSEKRTSFYKQELEEKNKEIDRLNVELKKCTCHLQSIVNMELWDKNRQIEKMESKKHEHTPELLKLRKSLSAKEIQLQALKEKISELGLDVPLPTESSFDSKDVSSSPKRNIEHIKSLQEALKAAKEEKSYLENKVAELEKTTVLVDKLKIENDDLLTKLETSEKLRFETNEICTALGTRLEELAIFLDSLLQQKSVLGFLGAAKNRRLREIISNSLDMSRSLSISLIDNPEQSLAQLSNITALLNGSVFQDLSMACEGQDEDAGDVTKHLSIVPSNITLTYESHLSYQKANVQPNPEQSNNEQVILALREQVFSLKNELQVRDNELARLQEKLDMESGVEKLTDTEEEKRNFDNSKWFSSGLKKSLTPRSNTTLTLTPKSNTSTITLRMKERSDVQSESEAWSEPDRVVSRARIGLDNSLAPPTPRSTKLVFYESTEDDETGIGISPAKKRLSLMEMHQEVLRLESELDQKIEENCADKQMYLEKLQELEQDIKSMKQKLLVCQNEKEQSENQIMSLRKTIEELSIIKANKEDKNKEMTNKLNEIEVEKNELHKTCLDLEKQAINAQNEFIFAQENLKIMEEKMDTLEGELRNNFEQSLIAKLQSAEEVFSNKIKQVEEIYEKELNKAKESVKHIQDECRRDYVKKTEVEKKLAQFEHLTTELNNLKTTVESYEETINSYRHKEHEMNDTVQDYQEKTDALRRNLDNTTLQYSEAVLEKTKLINDKTFLEQQLNRATSKEFELETKLSEATLRQNEQISILQSQKSTLELKISELETRNAELRNKLVKLQVEKCNLNRSLPILGGNSLVSYQRKCSDGANYSSEENGEELPSCFGSALNMTSNANLHVRTAHADAERTVANSSPDLGIESDHGRFSSLETQPVIDNGGRALASRPLLETIQLTECMNNLLDEQNNQLEAVNASDHCCRKSLEIIQENNDLKRKLLRMKRALEDTTTQLTMANQRKKQVEKTICKQIHKTSQVLRKAKANLDSGSEL